MEPLALSQERMRTCSLFAWPSLCSKDVIGEYCQEVRVGRKSRVAWFSVREKTLSHRPEQCQMKATWGQVGVKECQIPNGMLMSGYTGTGVDPESRR